MIPGELFGQTSQLIGGASSEQGAHTRLSQGKVPHSLQQVEENREGTVWRTSASREFTMLNSLSEQCGMSQRVGAPRVLESQPRKLIGREATRGDDVDERKL